MTAPRNIPFGRPWLDDTDRTAVLDVLNGHILTHGPQCKSFEDDFGRLLGIDAHCVTVSSCMAALHLAYLHFRIGPGDEVIVPAQTHTATVHAVEWVGARPIFVDCDPGTGNMTPEVISAAITPRTKAIGLVHFVGIPCDMPSIMKIAEEHNLKVIEDCAIALGARYGGIHVGLFGDAGCFSFYPVKHITTGEGGMFVTKHEGVASKVAKLRAFGVDRAHGERSIPGIYDAPELGLNYRMSEMQAALGLSQLKKFEQNIERRQANFAFLKRALSGIQDVRILDSPSAECSNSHYCMSLVLQGHLKARRNEMVGRLNRAGVGTSIYYPHPVPRMTYYRSKYGYRPDAFPHAEDISDHSIALPVWPGLEEADMEYIGQTVSTATEELDK